MEGERVDHQRIAKQVEVLPGMPKTVCPTEVVGVHDASVNGFGVVPRPSGYHRTASVMTFGGKRRNSGSCRCMRVGAISCRQSP